MAMIIQSSRTHFLAVYLRMNISIGTFNSCINIEMNVLYNEYFERPIYDLKVQDVQLLAVYLVTVP